MKKSVKIFFVIALLVASLQHSGYAQWSSQTSGVGSILFSTYFTDANTGYVAGNGVILKTTDGGSTWSTVSSSGSNTFYSIYCTDAQTCYTAGAAGTGGTIQSTIDGGITWTPYSLISLNAYKGIFFANSTTGYVVGDGQVIQKTINSGTTWTDISPTVSNANYSSVYFTDINNGYVVGTDYSNPLVLKTTDGGTTWATQAISGSGAIIFTSVHFPTSSTGYITGTGSSGGGYILKTTNAGLNWTVIYSVSEWLNSIFFTDVNTGYVTGWNGKIYKTTDGGANWNAQTSATTNELKSIFFSANGTGYTVGLGGSILKNSFSASTNELSKNMDIKAFPNPFSTSTKITLPINANNLIVIIYDLLGREVLKISDIETNELLIEKKNLKNGTYLCTVISDNQIITRNKLVIQ